MARQEIREESKLITVYEYVSYKQPHAVEELCAGLFLLGENKPLFPAYLPEDDDYLRRLEKIMREPPKPGLGGLLLDEKAEEVLF